MPDAYSRGGGSGRLRTGFHTLYHPADGILADLRRRYDKRYDDAARDIATAIADHLRDYAARAEAVNRLSAEQQTAFLVSMFTGRAWRMVRRSIARKLYAADKAAIDAANKAAPEAFAEAANQSAFRLSFGGAQGGGGGSRGGGSGRLRTGYGTLYDPLPYTADVVLALAAKGLIDLAARAFDRDKDQRYAEQRAQTIAMAEAILHTPIADMADTIARRLTDSLRAATDAIVQIIIFAAWDAGTGEAGEDAARAGCAIEKTWLGIPDTRIRDSHRHLHNTTVPLGAVFHGLDGDLRYPHDPAAPPSETMRCRCRLAVHPAGAAPEAYDGALPLVPSQVAEYQRWRDAAIRRSLADLLRLHLERRRAA